MTTDAPHAAVHRVRITGLSYGPHGVGRVQNKVVFVRGVVPGEEVDVIVREDHRSYAYADLHAVVAGAPTRRVPPCPYLPRCGGCPWQHLEYAAQLQAKQQNLREHWRRTPGLADVTILPIIGSPQEFAYRSRLTLRVEERRVGFYAGASHDLVAIDHCLLGTAAVQAALTAAATLARTLDTNLRRIEIVDRGTPAGVVLRGEAEGAFCAPDADRVVALLHSDARIAGIVLHGKAWRQVWGDERVTLTPEADLTLTARCGAFTQVNPAGNQVLVRSVLAMGDFEAPHRVLDLYAGVGNLSFPLARRVGHVVAVEHDRRAAEDARANAQALNVTNCEIIAGSAATVLRALQRQGRTFDVVVLDPPRSGAADVVPRLLDLRPACIVYVSCNPATLVRDLARLTARYRVVAVQPIDLFPHSYHVETVAKAILTC